MSGTRFAHARTGRPAGIRIGKTSTAAALLLCAGLLMHSAAPAQAATASEERMGYYVNKARAAYGRTPLKLSWGMTELAHKHSYQMATKGTLYHTSNLSYTLRSFSWSVCGENVGVGPSLWRIYEAFMKSAPHKANIVHRSYERMGVGVVWKNGFAWVTIMFADYD